MHKPHIKYSERCSGQHLGSSTCCGCDPNCWLDDYPYKNKFDAPNLMPDDTAWLINRVRTLTEALEKSSMLGDAARESGVGDSNFLRGKIYAYEEIVQEAIKNE